MGGSLHRALLGNLEGVPLLRLSEKKKMHIWVPFLGPRGH